MSENPPNPSVPTRWHRCETAPDMWVDPAEDPRETGTPSTDERTTLREYLRAYRMTLEMKCADLDAAAMARRSVPPSTMSLLGLVRHMAEVERGWFRRGMAGEDAPKLWCTPQQPDADWDDAAPDPGMVTDAWSHWHSEVAFADDYLDRTPDLTTTMDHRGTSLQLRDLLVHMIEEYARHCGHADLLRECIDGRVGQ